MKTRITFGAVLLAIAMIACETRVEGVSGFQRSPNLGLSALTTSAGTFNPPFDPTVTRYDIVVDNAVSSMTFTPTVGEKGATITINGFNLQSGATSDPIPLNVGTNTITIVVTTSDGFSATTYTIVVTRNA